MELIGKLGIDLKLLLAQIVNFGILLFILTKLLYKPLLGLLDKRKEMIKKSVENAEKIEERLKKLEEEKDEVMANASKDAMVVLENAKKQAEEEHGKALEKAKREISGFADRYRAQLKEEKAQMMQEIRKEVAEMVIMSSEKILQKEFSKEDQRRLVNAINEELKSVKY